MRRRPSSSRSMRRSRPPTGPRAVNREFGGGLFSVVAPAEAPAVLSSD
jgi:hypothetical protein